MTAFGSLLVAAGLSLAGFALLPPHNTRCDWLGGLAGAGIALGGAALLWWAT